MKQKILFYAVLIAFAFIVPHMASADTAPIRSDVYNPTILNGPLLLCTGDDASGMPPCENLCDLVAQVANVVYFMIAFVIWIITPILIMASGIMYMLAGANPEMIKKAKGTITGAVWGVAIVLCAYLIIYTFVNFMGITGVGGFGTNTCSLS